MISLDEIKELTRKGEQEYAPVPPSQRGDGKKLRLDDILAKIKPIAIKKPAVFIVGSLAVHGESDNDIDILLTGEYTERDKEAERARIEVAIAKGTSGSSRTSRRDPAAKEKRRRKARLQEVENKVAALEKKLAALEKQLETPPEDANELRKLEGILPFIQYL